MTSCFHCITHIISQYRITLVIICVIILHGLIFFHSLCVTKNQVNDLAPQNVISATMIKSSGAKTLSTSIPESRDLASERVADFKFFQTELPIKKQQTRLNESISAAPVIQNINRIKSATASEKTNISSSQGAMPESQGEGGSDMHSLNHEPVHLAHPRFKHNRPAPAYPQQALRLRQDGVVVIRVLISKSGQVTEASIQQSSGSAWLDLAAKNAALEAQFYPHLVNGVAYHSQADLPFKFVMK